MSDLDLNPLNVNLHSFNCLDEFITAPMCFPALLGHLLHFQSFGIQFCSILPLSSSYLSNKLKSYSVSSVLASNDDLTAGMATSPLSLVVSEQLAHCVGILYESRRNSRAAFLLDLGDYARLSVVEEGVTKGVTQPSPRSTFTIFHF